MLLLVKVRNAVELFWEVLDERERMIVAYAVAWAAFVFVLGMQRRSRDKLRDEILIELRDAGSET